MLDESIAEQITNIHKAKWVNLQALIDCSADHLAGSGSRPTCQSITLLGRGSFNNVYRLVFDNGIQLAASVSREREILSRGAQLKESEIQTMKFVRESGLYPDIHVPKVHAWDTTYTNPVGSPYVLRDVVEGEIVDLEEGLTHVQQLAVLKALAKLKASLSKPVSFNKIGCIIADPAGDGHSVGPFFTFDDPRGPFKSAQELWRFSLQHKILRAVREWCALEKDEIKVEMEHRCTPQQFTELFQMLSSLIPYFKIPKAYNHFVLHHPDIALRNVLFDKESLSSDQPRITGLIDWDGAKIFPFMLTGQYPGDLQTSGQDPYEHCNYRLSEDWRTIPFDWTSFAEPKEPRAYRDGELVELRPRASMMIRRYYLRTYFSACFAEEMQLLYGDAALPHATLYQDAPYYLKFNELMSSDYSNWLNHAEWIRETYWRFRTLVGTQKVLGEDFLVTGPHIYLGSVERGVFDLGIAGEDIPTVGPSENDIDQILARLGIKT